MEKISETQIKELGVMTSAEIGMIIEEVIPTKEPLQEEDVIVK